MKKSTAKITALFLLLMFVLPSNAFLFSAFAQDEIPEGYTVIEDSYDLQQIKKNLSGKYFIANDIEIYSNWTPIGTQEEPFTGILEGNKKIITNLKIVDENVTGAKSIGLFAYTSGATVSNLFVKDASVTVKQPYDSAIEVNVGVLAGSSDKSVFKNCIVTGKVDVQNIRKGSIGGVAGKMSVCSFTNVTNAADVSIGTDAKLTLISVGGIIGEASGGMINQCSNAGNVSACGTGHPDKARRVLIGGIAGGTAENNNQIVNCYNTGDIGIDFSTPSCSIGGIVGECRYAETCYNTGEITVPTKFAGFVGAIAGNLKIPSEVSGIYPAIKKCYYINDGLVTSYISSAAPAETDFTDCKKLTEEEFKTAESFAGFNFNNIWQMEENGYPVLKQQVSFYEIFEKEHIINGETSGECGDNLSYTFNTYTGDLQIYGTGDMDNYDSLSWIETWNHAPWHREADKVKNVVISEGVTSIGACAFDNCVNVQSISIPSTVKSIGWGAFAGCGMENINIPDGVETIGRDAFYACSALKTIKLPKSVTEIEEGVFDAGLLEAIIVDNDNPNYSSDEYGVLFNKDKTVLIRYPVNSVAVNYTVPDGVTELETGSFASSVITSVVLPEGLKKIRSYAFEGCRNLEQIDMPDSVETIGSYAFCWCSSLEEIELSKGIKEIFPYAFYMCEALKSINIPEGVSVIDQNAFLHCTALETVTLPGTLTEIGRDAFYKTAYFDNAENRNGNALYNGKYLLDVLPEAEGSFVIKEGTELIAGGALSNCVKLTEITIPDSVKYIGEFAFSGCKGIKSIVLPESVVKTGEYIFSQCSGLESVVILGNITVIENSAFYRCEKLTNAVLPDTVKTIGDSAFNLCSSLETLQLPEGVEVIGKNAFSSSPKLANINFPESLISIGDYAFEYTNISSVNIPSGVTSIGVRAFSNTPNLVGITVDENNACYYSDGKALYTKDKSRLLCYPETNTDLIYVIPNETQTIDELAFSGNPYLETVTVPDGVEKLYLAFDDCTNLRSFAFGNNTKQIYAQIFDGCALLEKVYVPASVNYMASQLFYRCNGLKDIYYGGDAEKWAKTYSDSYLSENVTVHFNHTHSHTYSGYTEADGDRNGYKLYQCECGHYYAEFDVVTKSDEYDVSATYSPDCFSEEITLNVAEVTDNREPGGVYIVDGKTYVQSGVFSIKPVNSDGEIIQPNEGSEVVLRMPIPEEHKDKTSFVVYHRFVDGGRERFSTDDGTLTVEDGYMVFRVSKFSDFELYVQADSAELTKLPSKTVYSYKEQLDLNGFEIKIVKADGSVEYVTDASLITVSGFDSTKPGEQTVTLSYGVHSFDFTVTVRYTWWQWLVKVLLMIFNWI